jgi:hypothetical protein
MPFIKVPKLVIKIMIYVKKDISRAVISEVLFLFKLMVFSLCTAVRDIGIYKARTRWWRVQQHIP